MRASKRTKRKTEVEQRYFNREASWLAFNRRVLEEAQNPRNPLLERLRFLSIVESNLDEFYMVRVSGLIEQVAGGVSEPSFDGLSPQEQLDLIGELAVPLRKEAGAEWESALKPVLAEQGVTILEPNDWKSRDLPDLDAYFREQVFHVCTPLILDPSPTVHFISNRSLNLAVVLEDAGEQKLARVKIPDVLRRTVRVSKRKHEYVLLEDLIRRNLHTLFPGVNIVGSYVFRVLRDADIEIRELEAGDLIDSIEESLRLRRFGDPVLLEVSADMPAEVRRTLQRLLELDDADTFVLDGLIGLSALAELADIDRPNLRFKRHVARVPERLASPSATFEAARETDVLVHHPFDSFRPIEEFIASAATDPDVIGIKQTLYRVGAHSPVVESLKAAAEAGKQVAVMVELKARFDETNNLQWAKALEQAGVHVTFGFPELKTHCKLCLVVRREGGAIRTYAHIGTGNYNPSTARLYTDLGIITCDPQITQDVAELFNFLTGFSKQRVYRRLLVAPINLREGLVERIRREAGNASRKVPARIMLKLNSLSDPEMIDALYEASQAGVPIDLVVRGICCLRPGVPGLSENIRVVSIVGRFLEHSRIFYFENAGDPDVLIGSADLMRRNLDRRVEVLAPVLCPLHVRYLKKSVLGRYLRDNTNAWDLDANGRYVRRKATKDPHCAQIELCSDAR